MEKVNFRCGLTRLYLVLWAIYIPLMLWDIHKRSVNEYNFLMDSARYEESNGMPASAEASRASAQRSRKKEVPEQIFLGLVILGIVYPALLYGFLYGSIMTLRWVLRWVIRGFKNDPPERPTSSP